MVFWTPAIHNPFLFHGFDEPLLLALKFEKNGTELSFVGEVNTYPYCVLKRLLSQVLENCLQSLKRAEDELAVRTLIRKKMQSTTTKTPRRKQLSVGTITFAAFSQE